MALAERATELRSQFLLDAQALARRSFLDGERLNEIKGKNGYRNIAVDLALVTSLVR